MSNNPYIPRMDHSSRGRIKGKCRRCNGKLIADKEFKTLCICEECGTTYNKEWYM